MQMCRPLVIRRWENQRMQSSLSYRIVSRCRYRVYGRNTCAIQIYGVDLLHFAAGGAKRIAREKPSSTEQDCQEDGEAVLYPAGLSRIFMNDGDNAKM